MLINFYIEFKIKEKFENYNIMKFLKNLIFLIN